MASRLDKATGQTFRVAVLQRLFDGLRTRGERLGDTVLLEPGPMGLFVAPTGGGKSVLATVAALEWATSGRTVALVVPRVADTLKLAHELEDAARALELRVRVVPLNSPAGLFQATADALEHPPSHDPEGRWTLSRLGYSCALSAWSDEGEVKFGEEPCDGLAQVSGKRHQKVVCPFAASCQKFSTQREAFAAEILVVNHAAMLTGKVPNALASQTTSGRMTILELVLRRCDIVLIDEVDQLQARAIEERSGTFELSSLGRLSLVQDLYAEFELKRATGQVPREVDAEPIRQYLHLVSWVSEELADRLNGGGARWSGKSTVRWSGGNDAWLARRLFGGAKNRLHRLGAIFGRVAPRHESDLPLWRVVRRWSGRPPDDRDNADEYRKALRGVLDDWSWPEDRSERVTAEVVDGLFMRATLARVERALRALRPHLAALERWDIQAASRMRDQLFGGQAWAPSPLGPLARSVVGFSFEGEEREGRLKAHALTGDPHGLLRGLGDEVALGLAGRQTVVLGLSATARFHGSARSDVRGEVVLAQPDGTERVEVRGVAVRPAAPDAQPIRVSGVGAHQGRLEALRHLASRFWETHLEAHLDALVEDPATSGRPRVLLATGSYDEALAAGAALAHAMNEPGAARARIRVVARQKTNDDYPLRLLPREIETFGETGARILVAPLQVIARGYNIMRPDGAGSAIASVFVLVRPVPPTDRADRALAHVSYDAALRPPSEASLGLAVLRERKRAELRLRRFQDHAGPLGRLPKDLRHEVLCDVLVDIAQIAGRARRSRDRVQLYLVDGAFHVEDVGWRQQIRHAFKVWRRAGALPEMLDLHRSYLMALGRFAGLETE
ncbi:MAG: hypothetical protein ACOZNI_29040 [Myxococcota bacterium]